MILPGDRVRVLDGPCVGRRGTVYDDNGIPGEHGREVKVQLDGESAGSWWPETWLERLVD